MGKWGGARGCAWYASWLALAWSAPALAGEEILYQPAPDWIAPVDLAAAAEQASTSIVVLDQQVRLESGRLWQYSDTAYRIATPQELTQAGTITADWLPDKGDLIVHEVAIIRAGEVIDVLGQGAKLSTLRREQALEQRVLNGQLTATLAIPGLQVGDILRTRVSVTRADQALGDELESLSLLYREPEVRPGFARLLASWEHGAPVRFGAGPAVDLPAVETREGYDWLELTLPLGEAEEMPQDAPMRFLRPPLLQVSTFADWAEVAGIMAPHYDVAGAIAPGSALADRARAIEAEHASRLSQAVAALELVQEEIGYLANGLDGGNYLPQLPEETWSLRYGDCKAKTVLLLALLGELGIEAEAVLVSTEIGDALPQLLPMAGVFDHVLVRAKIDGKDYWLDGTSAGANERIAGNVPPFGYGLPLRASGAELEPIVQVLPRAPDAEVVVDVDQRAGIDIPALVRSEFRLLGPGAAMINAARDNATEDKLFQLGAILLTPVLGFQDITSVELEPGEDDSELTVRTASVMKSPMEYAATISEQPFDLIIGHFDFNPDRARRQWRDLPVRLTPAAAGRITYQLQLPDSGKGYTLTGATAVDETVAGQILHREATLDGDRLKVFESVSSAGGELPAGQIAAEKRRAASLARKDLALQAPADAARRWQYAGDADRGRLAPIEAAYTAQIQRQPDEMQAWANRGNFRRLVYDFAGAVEDYTSALDIRATPEIHHDRAWVRLRVHDVQGAVDDMSEAYALDPTVDRALALADTMDAAGQTAEAREVLEELNGEPDGGPLTVQYLADLDALEGDARKGLARLDVALGGSAGDADILGAKCWYMAAWQVDLAQALPLCTRAVENTQDSAAVLDSRALAHLRTGALQDALADADAALALNPAQVETILLRGLILRAMGAGEAEASIREALARDPSLATEYRRYGFDLPA